MKKSFLFFFAALTFSLCAAEYQISNIKITGSKKQQLAVDELKKHLELTGDKLAPGKDALEILVGRNPGCKDKLAPGESRWLYKEGKLYIWGNDKKQSPGVLFAVYGLLEEKFGVRWLFPGDAGIHVPVQKTVSFKENESYKRVPPFIWAYVRCGQWLGYNARKNLVPGDWRLSDEQLKQLAEDNAMFSLRHRHGRLFALRYGHAFTKWPDRFEKTHPEYFGVGPYGKPSIPPNRKTAKLCLSNPDVIEQIIADWKAAGKRQYLNISPNDGTAGYCLCAKCMALDTRTPDENFYSHLTDRYLNFWNRVAKRAVQERPDVMVTTYVYSYYRHPPRREKIEYPDNMLCGLVPALAEDSGALFAAWKAVGMKHCFIRPNDTHPASAQIRGLEKRIFDKFQASRKVFKLYGADYDSTLGVKARDLEHYIAARMIAFPEKSFDELMDEFCSGYGAAAAAVKEFYTNLRPAGIAMYMSSAAGKRNQQVLDDAEITVNHDAEYVNVITVNLKKLEAFPMDKLSAPEQLRLKRLITSAQESIISSKMQMEAVKMSAGQKNDFNAAAKELWDFRAKNKDQFPDNYPSIVYRTEKRYWNSYQPYRNASGSDGAILTDLAAGWRNSFDEPSLQGWRARDGYREITNKEASFDRYSVAAKDTVNSKIVIQRPRVAVTPGAKYTLSYDVKAPGGAKFRCRVVCNGKTLTNISGNAVKENWTQLKKSFTIPQGVDNITLYITIAAAPQGGYIDNIVLSRE